MSVNYQLRIYRSFSRMLLMAFIGYQGLSVSAQTLSLHQCYELAQELTPLAQQQLFHQSIAVLQKENANSLFKPEIGLDGQYTYQSDVFSLPFENPDGTRSQIPRDQYRLTIGINQQLFDGGSAKRLHSVAESEATANRQEVTVALYQIREIINELFFGAIMNQENVTIMASQRAILEEQLSEVESGVRNGLLLASNADIVKKEILSVEQQLISFDMDREALLEMLEAWIGQEVSDETVLLIPNLTSYDGLTNEINRPELRLFDLKSQQLQAQSELTAIKNYPKISAFANGGMSSPNPYDFFRTDLSGYYLTGIRLKWNIFDWNKNKNDIKMLNIQREIITSNRDDFERRTAITIIRNDAEIKKLEILLAKDKEILDLQRRIVKESYAQLQNGVITSTNYITELNKETAARIALNLRGLAVIRTKIEKLTKSGNYEIQN